jgi:membrane associated rhomboid family serine protease
MLIPIRTDRPPRRSPIVTESLIGVNLLVYAVCVASNATGQFDLEQVTAWMHFDPQDFRWWQLLTSMFMHDPYSIWHLAFNMLFLWVFGAPVEDRLGKTGFLGFYLIGGVVAALAHSMISPAPIIGASGAIAGVTGAFLALFPRSRIIVVYWLFYFGFTSVPSLYLIGFYFVVDVLRQGGELLGARGSGVAYMAHIAGYLYGFTLAFVLLASKIIKREEYDIFFLFTQARRRAAFRAASRSKTGGLWESASADTGKQLARNAKPNQSLSADEARLAELRSDINRLVAANSMTAATTKYRQLLKEAPDSVFIEQRQLELANQFYAEGDHAHAAAAYELLLDRYPRCHKAAEVRLILGLMYARQLNHPDRAREVIEAAKPSLHEPGQSALAEQLLAELPR